MYYSEIEQLYQKDIYQKNKIKEKDIKILLKKYQETEDKDVLKELILTHSYLFLFILKKYKYVFQKNNIYITDLTQQAIIGFIIACKKANYKSKICFSTYAIFWIKAEIFRFLNSMDFQSSPFVIPRYKYEQIKVVQKEIQKSEQELSIEELSKKTNLSTFLIKQILDLLKLRKLSIYQEVSCDDGKQQLHSFIEDKSNILIEEQYINKELSTYIEELLLKKYGKEVLKIFKMRYGFYGKKYTYKEIGRYLCKTPQAIENREKKILQYLREDKKLRSFL